MVLWAFIRTWKKDTFRRVAVAVTDCFSSDATNDLSWLGSVMAAVGGSASLFAFSGGSHVVADTYGEYLGSGYSHKLVEYPLFDLRLLKRCLQKVSFSLFGSLDPFSMLDDGIYCHASEGRSASRPDGFTLRSSSCHQNRRLVNAVAY